MTTGVTDQVAPRWTPIPREAGRAPWRLGERDRQLMETVTHGEVVAMVLKTGAMADVGQWLTNGRVWVAVTQTEVVLFASGKKPFVERTRIDQVRESLYNHITGELVLTPAHELTLRRFKLSALDGYRLLVQLGIQPPGGKKKETEHA